jgi:multicomponent Na+:H+ antiporter subunit A
MMLLTMLTILFVLALAAPFINRLFPKISGWILAIVPGVIFFRLLWLAPAVYGGQFPELSYRWLSALNLNFSLRLDGLSLIFALLVTGIGSLILIYAGYYMRSYQRTCRFFAYLVFFMASMLGLVLAYDWVSLFMFWEFTSISSFLLIGFKHEKEEARKAAIQALLITGLGGLALLSGILLMAIPYGSFSFSALFANPDLFTGSPIFIPTLILLLLAAFTKSAIFPFHFWLPGAMQAPSPVSAFLHSATMVKAGIYLLARLQPVMGTDPVWTYSLSIFGVLTMFMGAWFAIAENDLKRILAYTTVSALGTLVLLIGTSTAYSLTAALLFLLVHAFYKATLFMMAGNIEKMTGTRDIEQLGRLNRFMPVAAAISLLALLSMSGIPPMLGFIGKELIYEAKLHAPKAAYFILLAGFLANVFTVMVSGRFTFDLFYGKAANSPKTPKEPSIALLTGPAILVIISLLLGLFPNKIGLVLAPALKAMMPSAEFVKLKLWHGFNEILLLSAFTVLLGAILFLYREKIIPVARRFNEKYLSVRLTQRFFDSLDLFLLLTKKKTSLVQHGYHRVYLMTIFTATSVLLFFASGWIKLPAWRPFPSIWLAEMMAVSAVMIIFASLSVVMAPNRLVALISTGITGIGITIIFLLFGGVDLAITMVMVETLTVVIGAMVIYHLPRYLPYSTTRARIRDWTIAGLFGFMMMGLAMQAGESSAPEKISEFFVENSLAKGYGKNVVNVILVDFRALDTLGEITVLALAAIGVVALLKLNKREPKAGEN